MAAQSENAKAGENRFIPRHIAIIMDGNGRWARKRGLPRTAGHAVGAENFRKIATTCKNMGMDYLTVYAFSTENWKRPSDEVSAIMKLLKKYLDEAIETMARDRIRMKIFGNVDGLSEDLQEMVAKTDAISAGYEGFQANICLNYGGRDEIVRAASRFAREHPGETLTEGMDYTVTYPTSKKPGEYMVRVDGINGYKGTIRKTYTIK